MRSRNTPQIVDDSEVFQRGLQLHPLLLTAMMRSVRGPGPGRNERPVCIWDESLSLTSLEEAQLFHESG